MLFCRNSAPTGGGGYNGQQYSGNKPPLISGGKTDPEIDKPKLEEENNTFNQVHVEEVSAFYRISSHLYSKYR